MDSITINIDLSEKTKRVLLQTHPEEQIAEIGLFSMLCFLYFHSARYLSVACNMPLTNLCFLEHLMLMFPVVGKAHFGRW